VLLKNCRPDYIVPLAPTSFGVTAV